MLQCGLQGGCLIVSTGETRLIADGLTGRDKNPLHVTGLMIDGVRENDTPSW